MYVCVCVCVRARVRACVWVRGGVRMLLVREHLVAPGASSLSPTRSRSTCGSERSCVGEGNVHGCVGV